jgi:hypothetical protein
VKKLQVLSMAVAILLVPLLASADDEIGYYCDPEFIATTAVDFKPQSGADKIGYYCDPEFIASDEKLDRSFVKPAAEQIDQVAAAPAGR